MSDAHDRLEALEALAASAGYAELEVEMRKRAEGLVSLALHAETANEDRSELAAQWRELTERWIGWAPRRIEQARKQIERGR